MLEGLIHEKKDGLLMATQVLVLMFSPSDVPISSSLANANPEAAFKHLDGMNRSITDHHEFLKLCQLKRLARAFHIS